jgi:hypothetical protein
MSCCATDARRRFVGGKRASKSDQLGTNDAGQRYARVAMTSFVMNRLNSPVDLGPKAVTLDHMRKRPSDPIDILIETHLWLRAQERKARRPQIERTATARPRAKSPVKPRRTSR